MEPGQLLGRVVEPRGLTVPEWAVAPLGDAPRVLEVGPGVLGDALGGRWRLLDQDGRLVTRDDPGEASRSPSVPPPGFPVPWPMAANSVDALCLMLSLPWLRPVDPVFAEIRRVLRPAGTLVVVTPSVAVRTWSELQLARLLRPVRRGAWPNRSGLDNAGWILAAADFAVMGDDRLPFALPLPDAAAAAAALPLLPAAGLWPPGVPQDVTAELTRRAGPDRILPLPLRRLVARR